jgi:hypothetical protein
MKEKKRIDDQRARLSLKHPEKAAEYLGATENGVMTPLKATYNGIIFPYSPTIQTSFGANYGTYDTTHSIYQQQYYINSVNPSVSFTAPMAVQTQSEARYALAMMQFLKSATKGNFGQLARGKGAGMPPPVLLFNAYGGQYKNIPVIVKSVSWNFTEDIDMVEFSDTRGTKHSIPVSFTFSIDLGIQMPPSLVEKDFNIQHYRNGNYLNGSGFL